MHKAALALLVVGLVLGWGLFHYYPAVPHSVAGWAAFIFLGLPLLIGAEAAGEWFHGLSFHRSWPSGARILFGVLALLIFLALFYVPFAFVVKLIES